MSTRPAPPPHSAERPSTLILLDIDGTLLHADGAGRAAMERSLRLVFGEFGARADLDGHSFGGKPDAQTLHELLLPLGVPRAEIAARLPQFTANLAEEMARIIPQHRVRALPGVPERLQHWRARGDVLLGLLTGNTRASAPVKLRAAGIDPDWFLIGAFGDEAPQRNQLALLALQRANAWRGQEFTRERVFVIGDTPADVACARAIHARAIAISSGYCPREELLAAAPDQLVESFHELATLLD
ncbi:MAG: haloacid dehalogenase-like hydrolase [Anaerolineaceae bacterium]|nr:haloacid dehalogenase-like hydrolase [Anaerolineaceae bacterium]